MVTRESIRRIHRRSSKARNDGVVGSMICKRCDVEMHLEPSASRCLYYLACPRCGTRLASSYSEVLRSGTTVKPSPVDRDSIEEDDRLRVLRARAERFQRRLENSDPYRVLALRAGASFAEVKARYHRLAARHHPDHGGDPDAMREVIDAYERIRAALGRQP